MYALAAASRALAGAASVIEGAQLVLALLGESEGWSAGAIWIAAGEPAGRPRGAHEDRAEEGLRCAGAWCAPPLSSADFERASNGLTALRGPVARAFTSGRAASADAARDEELRRDPRVERDGYRTAAAIPVFAGDRVALVIELFSRAPRDLDAVAEELWSSAAAALGMLARRASAERRLGQAEAALQRSEAQLIEADRLAALGTLAAGVAHEINNPLSYVLLNLDLMIRELSSRGSSELVARLAEARSGVERVRLIVQDLKSFSRTDTERRRPVDVRRVLDSTLEIAGNEIRHRARLVRAFGDVPDVLADPSRLGQVFLNLLVNAAQAMVEGEALHNEIRVSTGVDGAGRVVVEIRDTGAGIAPEHLGRIFEPFFTTKPPGVGTGLGLSICHNIIGSLSGEIEVMSEVGRGTTFRVMLPALAGRAEGESAR